jgi:hypothetical protein
MCNIVVRYLIAFILTLSFTASPLKAQKDSLRRHALWIDILGPGGLIGWGYQYTFFHDAYVSFHTRIGLGGYFSSDLLAGSLPFEVIVAGSEVRSITWETGAALTSFLVSGKGRIGHGTQPTGFRSTLGLSFRTGLRLSITSRLAVRAAFHPHWMIAAPTGPVIRAAFPLARGFTPWGSLGLVWRFR